MFTNFVVGILTVWFSFLPYGSSSNYEIRFDARADKNDKIINIKEDSINIIEVFNISNSTTGILFEVHSHIHNITLSQHGLSDNSVTGRNVGLLYKLQSSESNAQIWLINEMKNEFNVLIIITSYDSSDPVPGGCNMEFSTEIAPYLKLSTVDGTNRLEFQHASMGFIRDGQYPDCSISSSYITYDVFVLHLKESDFGAAEYFDKITKMSNVSSIKKYANKVSRISKHPDTRSLFLMYPNIGVVFNVVAKYTVNGNIKESPYVPISSYGCGNSEFTEHGCNFSIAVSGKIFLFILSMYGFITAFFGYNFYGSTMFFFGFLAAFYIGLILLGRFTHFSESTIVILTTIIAILGGVLWFILWIRLHSAVISSLLIGLVFGYLVATTILYTPFGRDQNYLDNTNYYGLLTLGSIIIALLLLACPTVSCIVGSSIVGTYVMLLLYDDFTGSRLAFIILNTLKRAVYKDLEFASNYPPFDIKDALMYTAWVVLSLFAIFVQSRNASFSNNSKSCCCRSRRSNLYVTHNVDCDTSQPLCNDNNSVFYNTFPR